MRAVSVVVSDPWTYVDEQGSNVFAATVRETSGDLLLLEMAGTLYVATPRDSQSHNLTPTTPAKASEGPPWGRDDWRGHPQALLAQIRGL